MPLACEWDDFFTQMIYKLWGMKVPWKNNPVKFPNTLTHGQVMKSEIFKSLHCGWTSLEDDWKKKHYHLVSQCYQQPTHHAAQVSMRLFPAFFFVAQFLWPKFAELFTLGCPHPLSVVPTGRTALDRTTSVPGLWME